MPKRCCGGLPGSSDEARAGSTSEFQGAPTDDRRLSGLAGIDGQLPTATKGQGPTPAQSWGVIGPSRGPEGRTPECILGAAPGSSPARGKTALARLLSWRFSACQQTR